jgi:predicted dehydrogenase
LALWSSIRKIVRYISLYGVSKTVFKVMGRTRSRGLSLWGRRRRDIGVVGCGQFAFSTLGHAIWKHSGNRFSACFDVDTRAAVSFAKFYSAKSVVLADHLFEASLIRYVYIMSNHASHTPYAIQALEAGKLVYVEKPISVSREQLRDLSFARRRTGGTIFAGYNRPFSRAIRQLQGHCVDTNGPMTLSCFVSGHRIPAEHWYRNPNEGTRICGNLGHWLDLAVHILSWKELPDTWRISIAYSSNTDPDDNISISMTSTRGDLLTFVLTSRSEPFEGINETINFQQGEIIAKIDDFRKMTIWERERVIRYRYWPKDVGHLGALVQPFTEPSRDWKELELSTLLMLTIKDMVLARLNEQDFSFSVEGAFLESAEVAEGV